MTTMSERAEKAAESKVLTLIARGCMVASIPVALWVASTTRDSLKEQNKELQVKVDLAVAQVAAVNSNVQTINTTIAEGLRQTLESQGKRIENLERRQDDTTDKLDVERDRVTTLLGDVKMLTELSKLKTPNGVK
jgi:hypothetical protein